MQKRNITIIMGNLGKDPETKETKSGKKYTRFSIAVSNDYRKNDEWVKQPPTWWDCTAWEDLGEEIEHAVFKGDVLMVMGKAGASVWQGKDGKQNTKLELKVDEAYKPICPRKEKRAEFNDDERPRRRQPNQPDEEFALDMSKEMDDADEDIPF